MRGFEVLQRGNATQVECVLAYAAIASTRSLTTGDVREAVLDGHTLAEPVATAG